MRLLALDAGFSTGYACIQPGLPPITGTVDVPGSAAELGLACTRFGHLARDLLERFKPDGLVLCTPYISKKFQDINPTLVLFGFFGVAAAVAYSAKVPLYRVHEPQARRAFLAPAKIPRKSKEIKAAVLAACQARSWFVCDDHAADALVAALFQLDELAAAASQ